MLWYRITRQAGVMNQVLHVQGEKNFRNKTKEGKLCSFEGVSLIIKEIDISLCITHIVVY